MSIESLILSLVIDALEGVKVVAVDIPRTFTQSYMDELINLKFEGIMKNMLVKIDP